MFHNLLNIRTILISVTCLSYNGTLLSSDYFCETIGSQLVNQRSKKHIQKHYADVRPWIAKGSEVNPPKSDRHEIDARYFEIILPPWKETPELLKKNKRFY